MADEKISELPVATVVNPSDVLPIVQSGTTKQAAASLIGGGGGAATLELTSSGDVSDSATFNADNTGIRQKDVNDVTMFTLWSDGTFGGNICIVDKLPDGFEFGVASDNVFIGTQIGVNAASVGTSVAIGNSALQEITEGNGNVAVGQGAGNAITDGFENTFIGNGAASIEASAGGMCLIGSGTSAPMGVTDNAIALGADTEVTSDDTAVIGNGSITDVYFGSTSGDANMIGNVLKLKVSADPPSSPAEGMIYADTDHHLYYYNGTTWKQLDN